MRRAYMVLAGLVAATASVVTVQMWPSPSHTSAQESRPLSSKARPVEHKEPSFGLPARIVVDKVGINATVQMVGTTADGAMDVPGDLGSVGWYKRNPAPGNIGNAILAGHKGTPGAHGVFWRLEELQPYDRIRIYDQQGTEAQFEVLSVESFGAQDAPRERIFGTTSERRLQLITCDGGWLAATEDYTHRLVVFATLLQ